MQMLGESTETLFPTVHLSDRLNCGLRGSTSQIFNNYPWKLWLLNFFYSRLPIWPYARNLEKNISWFTYTTITIVVTAVVLFAAFIERALENLNLTSLQKKESFPDSHPNLGELLKQMKKSKVIKFKMRASRRFIFFLFSILSLLILFLVFLCLTTNAEFHLLFHWPHFIVK